MTGEGSSSDLSDSLGISGRVKDAGRQAFEAQDPANDVEGHSRRGLDPEGRQQDPDDDDVEGHSRR